MINGLITIAEEAAISAGKEIMRIFASGHEEILSKKDGSPATKADSLASIIIKEQLSKTGLPVLSEEEEMFWLVDPLDGTREFIKGLDEFIVNIALIQKRMPVGGVVYLPCQELMYLGEPGSGVIRIGQGRSMKIDPIPKKQSFPDLLQKEGVVIACSRSHQSEETLRFIQQFKEPVLKESGSSIKFIQILDGLVAIYPGMGHTMEWDTAAAHALLHLTNHGVYDTDFKAELIYNKPDLTNPPFIAL